MADLERVRGVGAFIMETKLFNLHAEFSEKSGKIDK